MKKSLSMHGMFFSLIFGIFSYKICDLLLLAPIKAYDNIKLADDFMFFLSFTVLSAAIISLMHKQISSWAKKIYYLLYQPFSCSHFIVVALTGFVFSLFVKCYPVLVVSVIVFIWNSFLVFLLSRAIKADNKPDNDNNKKQADNNQEESDKQEKPTLTFPLPDTPVEDSKELGAFNKALADTIFTTIDNYQEETYLSVALNGKWGSGKTSVIYEAQKQLEKNGYHVLTINFWKQKKAADVVMELERQLEEFFATVYFGWRFKELEFFKLAAGHYSAQAGTIFSLFEKISAGESMQSAKKELQKRISQALKLDGKKRIVVIFDDIDRVFDKSDLLFFLKAIVYLVGFENVVSLTTIDIDKVIKGLDQESSRKLISGKEKVEEDTNDYKIQEKIEKSVNIVEKDNLSNFIHKVFNVIYEMPKQNMQVEIVNYVKKVLISGPDTAIGIEEVCFFIDSGDLHDLIDNFREAKQVVNEYYAKLKMIREVNPELKNVAENIARVEIFMLSILKVRYVNFYNKLEKFVLLGIGKQIEKISSIKEFANKVLNENQYNNIEQRDCDYYRLDKLLTLMQYRLLPNSSILDFYFNPKIEKYQVVTKQVNEYLYGSRELDTLIKDRSTIDNPFYRHKNYIDFLDRVKQISGSKWNNQVFIEISYMLLTENWLYKYRSFRNSVIKSLLSLYNGKLQIDDVTSDLYDKYDLFYESISNYLLAILVELYSLSNDAFGESLANINNYNLLYFYLNPFHAHTFGTPTFAKYNQNLTSIALNVKSFYISNIANPPQTLATVSFYFWIIKERIRKSNINDYVVTREERLQQNIEITEEIPEMYREMLKLFMTETLSFIQTVNSKPFTPPEKTEENKIFYETCDEGLSKLLSHAQFDNYRPFEEANQEQICDFIKLLMHKYLMPETIKTIGVFGKHFEIKLKKADFKLPEQVISLDGYLEVFSSCLQINPQAGEQEINLIYGYKDLTYQEALQTLQSVNQQIKERIAIQ